MNARLLPGVIEMTGHYKGVLNPLPSGDPSRLAKLRDIGEELQQTPCTLRALQRWLAKALQYRFRIQPAKPAFQGV
jgi:hypothetical protein